MAGARDRVPFEIVAVFFTIISTPGIGWLVATISTLLICWANAPVVVVRTSVLAHTARIVMRNFIDVGSRQPLSFCIAVGLRGVDTSIGHPSTGKGLTGASTRRV